MAETRCTECREPEVDNSGIECGGYITPDSCIASTEGVPYFNLPVGTRYSKVLSVIVKAIRQMQVVLGRKIDYKNLQTYDTNEEAVDAGLSLGEPYKTSDGFVKVVVD